MALIVIRMAPPCLLLPWRSCMLRLQQSKHAAAGLARLGSARRAALAQRQAAGDLAHFSSPSRAASVQVKAACAACMLSNPCARRAGVRLPAGRRAAQRDRRRPRPGGHRLGRRGRAAPGGPRRWGPRPRARRERPADCRRRRRPQRPLPARRGRRPAAEPGPEPRPLMWWCLVMGQGRRRSQGQRSGR